MSFTQHFSVGARSSNLSMVQTKNTLARISSDLSGVTFELTPFSSTGDADQHTTLDKSPADFFTDQLDTAVLSGAIDAAIHSAKDLPEKLHHDLDWFWFPWQADPRDVVILPQGTCFDDLPQNPRVGISSDRRKAWADASFASWQNTTIRGTIERRIEQLDKGDFDLLLMAGAALVRLNLEERISRWIPLDELPPPEGQGYIAITFRKGDERFIKLRSFYTKACCFMGSGPGDENLCTLEGIQALQQADVCLHDSLSAPRLLEYLPPTATIVNVGKRAQGTHTEQEKINERIIEHIKRGKQVVRLKGGDPGIFGRLPEETNTLNAAQLPYWVIPGVSSFSAATTGTGMLLTRRGLARGFSILTPRAAGGDVVDISADVRSKLPLLFFMGISKISCICEQLLNEGRSNEEKVAVVFAAGTPQEQIIHATIDTIISRIETTHHHLPGLLMVGEFTNPTYKHTNKHGILSSQKVILTCSDALMQTAKAAVRAWGGTPASYPLISLNTKNNAAEGITTCASYDWIALTSPSAVRCFKELFIKEGLDMRDIPKIMVTGKKTAQALREWGLVAELTPETDFSSEGILALFKKEVSQKNLRILRCISSEAPTALSEGLRALSHHVDDVIVYTNSPITYDHCPQGDAIFFASASAVSSFVTQFGAEPLQKMTVISIGKPCTARLAQYNITPIQSPEATVVASITTLALHCL